VLEGPLQKRVVSVKIEPVKNVEKGFEGIGIVAVRKTHRYLRCDDGFKARESPIACAACYESEAAFALECVEPTDSAAASCLKTIINQPEKPD
jgi:hypothetical protein